MQKMTLNIHQLDPSNPNDHLYFGAIARIHLAAWLTVALMKTIYYGPPESYPAYLDSMVERHTKAFNEEGDCRFAVCLDDALPADEEVVAGWKNDEAGTKTSPPKGKVIAAIKYYFVAAPSAASIETAAPSSATEKRTWPPHSHEALASDFWSQLVRARELLTSKIGAHVLVDNLYTDPTQHRRGAGSLLMRYACKEADVHGLPSILEASPKGITVYQAVGYERFGEGGDDGRGTIWVDLERWVGGQDRGDEFTKERLSRDPERKQDGWYAQVLMVRPAKP